MNVGQVEAGIKLDGAAEALASARNLENALNGMDKKTYTAKVRLEAAKLGKQIAAIDKSLLNTGFYFNRLTKANARYHKGMRPIQRTLVKEQKAQLTNGKRLITQRLREANITKKELANEKKLVVARNNNRIAEYNDKRLQGTYTTLRKINRLNGDIARAYRGRALSPAQSFLPFSENAIANNIPNLRKRAMVYSTRYAKQIENINDRLRTQGHYFRQLSSAQGEYSGQLHASQRTMRTYERTMLKGGHQRIVAPIVERAKAMRNELAVERRFLRAQGQYAKETAFNFSKTQKAYQSNLVQTGSQLITLGNTISRVTAPFTRLFSGALLGAGFAGVNKVIQGFTGAFERYDILETFEARLKRLGLDTTKKFKVGTLDAMTAVDNLDQSVRGLPTGLDTIVASMERYAAASGDVEKATKLAIAANNTFIAGRMDDRSILFTERQLRALAGGAELTTTQWQSLERNAPLAIRAVAKELKLSNKELKEQLKSGAISGQKFLDTFIKVGTEGKIYSAAQKMKMTWEAVSQNIDNAFSRMGYNVLKTLDDVMEKASGKSLLQDILGVDKNGNAIGGGIKDYIDGLSESVQKWISANPDAILNFWEKLKNFDFAGIFRGFAQEVAPYVKAIAGALNWLGGENIGKLLGKATVVSKALNIGGGLMKGLAKPLSIFAAGGKMLVAKGGLGMFSKFFAGVSKIGTGIKVAAFSKAATFFRRTGDLGKADTFRKLANVSKAGKHLKGATAAVKQMDSLQGSIIRLSDKALNIAGIMAIAKSIEWLAKAFKTIGETNFDAGNIVGFGVAAGGLITEFALLSSVLGSKGVITGIAQFSRILGTLEIAAIAKTLQEVAKAMGDIGKVDVPDESKIDDVMSAMGKFLDAVNGTGLFESLGKQFSASAIGKTAKAVSKVTKAMSDIDKLKVDIGKVRKKLFGENGKGGSDSLIGVMDELVGSFNGNWLKEWAKKWQAGNVASIFESAANMVTDLKAITETKIKAGDIKKLTGKNGTLTQLKDSLKPIVDSMNELFYLPVENETAFNRRNGKYKDWNVGKKAITTLGAQSSQYAYMMESFKKAFKNVSGLLTEIGTMKANIDARKKQYGTKDGNLDFTAVASAIGGIATALSTLVEDGSLSTLNSASKQLEGFKVEGLKSIEAIFKSIVGIQKLMNENPPQAPGGNLGAPQQTISMVLGDFMAALVSMNTSITELGEMSEFVGNVSQLNAAMNYVKSVFVKIDEIKTLINGEQGGGIGADLGLSSIGSTISRVIQEISDATMKAPVVLVGATMLQGAFSALRSAFSKLNGIALNAETSATTITTAINTLESIGNKIINISITIEGTVTDGGIPAQIRAVANAITLALAQIKSSYGKKVSVKVKGSVSDGGVPAKIRQVALAIRLAAAAIPTNISRHVNVSITGTVTKDIPISTGGLIRGAGQTPVYRKMGGFAFQPKGTDTVPAMLTPGEYVVRRKAVDTFGARFLQRINHLDVKGALNALSIKAGQSILPSRSTVINNHTNNYNNVNLGGITNNNPRGEVGLVKAGRMIHALQH